MNRLTTPDGDYCRDECGQAGTCKRLGYTQLLNRPEARCKDALRYERLQMYENIEEQAEGTEGPREAFLKEAQACQEEHLRLQRRIQQLRGQMKTDHSQELRDKLAVYEQMAFEMRTKERCFRRRAEERRETV